MLEAPARHPLARRRRRARLWRRLAAAALGWRGRIVLALLAVVLAVGAVARVASRADRPDAATALRDGRAALARGNYSAARNHFVAAVAAAPGDAAAQAALAHAYLLLGEGLAAQGALDRALAAGAPPAALRAARAEALLLQRDPAGALALLGDDGTPVAIRARARALAATGEQARAAALLERLAAATPRDAVAWRDLARVRLDRGDVGGAALAGQRALALAPRDPAALVLRGELVRSQYGLVAALPWFEAALRRDAYYHPALIEYAGTLGDAGRHADSVAAAQRALAARPGSPQALYLLAVVAARAGRFQLASDLLDRTGGALDGLPGGLLLSGGLDYAAGRGEQAVLKWRALLARQPMNLVARRLLGAALLRSGDAAAALEALRPLALRTDADSYTLGLVARAFEARGQRAMAARFLDRAAAPVSAVAAPFGQDAGAARLAAAASATPDDPAAAVAWVRGLLEGGEGPRALAQAQALVRAAPGAPAAQLLLGDVLAATGRLAAAATPYARAADLRFDAPAMLRLVEARAAAGDRRGAADVLALFLAQNPSSFPARRMLVNAQLAAGTPARATLEALLRDAGGRDVALLAALSRACLAEGDAGAALAHARAAYALQPLSPAATRAYGAALLRSGNRAGARQLMAKVAALR